MKAKPPPHVEADDLARSLGAAIGKELPESERGPLRSEITRWVDEERRREKRERKPRGDGSDPPLSSDFDELLEKLLNAMVHPFSLELGE